MIVIVKSYIIVTSQPPKCMSMDQIYFHCIQMVFVVSEMMNFQADKSEIEQLKKNLEDEKMKKKQVMHLQHICDIHIGKLVQRNIETVLICTLHSCCGLEYWAVLFSPNCLTSQVHGCPSRNRTENSLNTHFGLSCVIRQN